uniref:CCT domain-containing protein n=1 Tax=Oryza meridionalis TaxID=40149 RepID=A0A0E0F172_9ORYZ
MELDGTESSKMNLIADFTAPLSSDDSLVCYAIPCSMELSDTSVVNKCPHQSTGFPDYAKACTECDSGLTSCERVDRISQDHDILSGSSIYSKNKDLYSYSDISVFSETHKDFAEPLELPPCGKDDEAPPDLAAQLHCNSCKDVMMPPQVINDEVEPVDRGATILVEHTPCGPETALTAFLYDKGSIDTTSKTDELAKQNSNSLEGDVAKIHEQLLNYSYASGEVEISLTRSEKRTKKLRSQHPIYVPFLGFLKSVSFKKKASKGWSSSSSSSSSLRRVEEEVVGRYSAEERRERIDKYRSKRNQRNFDKKITYACRKTLADSRPRVKGRFARNSDDDAAAAAAAQVEVSPATNNNVPEWWPAVQEALARQEQEAAGLHLCDTADDDLLAAYLGVSSIDLYSPRGH